MAKRTEHLFQFNADEISEAAKAEREYHEERVEYWKDELEKSMARVKETVKVDFQEQHFTGGKRLDVGVHYGDPIAYRRMGEAQQKIQNHQNSAERFRSDEQVYGSQQQRSYDLDRDDVHHFRLHGGEREE